MTDDQLLRYSRHVLLDDIGVEGQQRLLAAHAVVIGAGGLGSPVAMYLASVGFGMSLGRVARAFGRDRSTVRHACRVMEERRENPGFDRWMDALEASVAHAPVSA